MSRHTPGQWYNGPFQVKDARGIEVADCVTEKNRELPLAEKQANARLIAAAPDLLEALRKLRLEAQHYKQTGGKGVQFLDGAINCALEVIARAEGQS